MVRAGKTATAVFEKLYSFPNWCNKNEQESRAIAKMTARWTLYMDALKNFVNAHGYLSRNC